MHTIFFLFFLFSSSSSFYVRIMKTPLFSFFPIGMKHHALIISKTNNTDGVYRLDYTPITLKNETVLKTRIKLLLGQIVPAEIRLRFIRNVKFHEDKKILESEDLLDIIDAGLSNKISKKIYQDISDVEIKRTIFFLMNKNRHNNTMSLYHYNCQNFCKDSMKELNIKEN